jgi:hypothetical protein
MMARIATSRDVNSWVPVRSLIPKTEERPIMFLSVTASCNALAGAQQIWRPSYTHECEWIATFVLALDFEG